jgi:hypothetical protein
MTEPLEFKEDENQLESEEDIGSLDQKSFSNAVLSGNDWTTETIINQINKGNILLNPDFQRRDAWDKVRKSRFIESLILGLPIPQIVLAESKEKKGSYIVLDGKQRLLSIRQFSAEPNDEIYNPLKLNGLKIRDDLNKKNLSDLKGNLEFFEDLSAFENQPIRTVVIKNWPNEDFLYHVFLRLNTGSVPLSPQELRQALHPGPFVSFLDNSSANSIALQDILKLKKPDFRMRDTELLLRYYAFKNFLPEYSGTLKKFLDDSCKTLNKKWPENSNKIIEQLESFEQSHLFIKSVFKDNKYRKWSGSTYESRFNRAVFDILILSFDNPEVRNKAAGKESQIEDLYKALCNNNKDFMKSIESTTKSLTATQTRFSAWFNSLNNLLGSNLQAPNLIETNTN